MENWAYQACSNYCGFVWRECSRLFNIYPLHNNFPSQKMTSKMKARGNCMITREHFQEKLQDEDDWRLGFLNQSGWLFVSWTWGMGEVCNMLLDRIMGRLAVRLKILLSNSWRLGANISNGAQSLLFCPALCIDTPLIWPLTSIISEWRAKNLKGNRNTIKCILKECHGSSQTV